MQQYIGFNVNSNEYMIPILKIREIISMPSVTALPHLPPYVKGVTNLRGSIIPVVNLNNLLYTGSEERTGNTIIVVATGKITFGIIVDGITGVIKVDESCIEPPEHFLNNNVDKVEGVAKLNDKLIVLLNIKKLLPLDDMSLLEDAIINVKELDEGNNVEITKEVETIGGKVIVKELRDAKVFFGNKHDKNDPKYKIFDMMLSFMDALAAHEYQKVEVIVDQLVKETDSDLFKEVGKITRKLHDSLEEFKMAVDHGLDKLTKDDVPNAVDKLQFVMTKTEDAANRTMAIVERYFEESDAFSKHISNLNGPEESVNYFTSFKESLDNDMTSILTAQQFQDITGQTIKKVINLVNSLEVELVELITNFGMPVKVDAERYKNAASDRTDDKADVSGDGHEKVTQSDVEAMLNDFGF